MGRARTHAVSWLRSTGVATAFTGMGDQRDAQHPAGMRTQVGTRANARVAGPDASAVLAHPRRGQEARLRGPVSLQRRPEFRECAPGPTALDLARAIVVREVRS